MRLRSMHTLPGARDATWPSTDVPVPQGTTGVRCGGAAGVGGGGSCVRRARRPRRRARREGGRREVLPGARQRPPCVAPCAPCRCRGRAGWTPPRWSLGTAPAPGAARGATTRHGRAGPGRTPPRTRGRRRQTRALRGPWATARGRGRRGAPRRRRRRRRCCLRAPPAAAPTVRGPASCLAPRHAGAARVNSPRSPRPRARVSGCTAARLA